MLLRRYLLRQAQGTIAAPSPGLGLRRLRQRVPLPPLPQSVAKGNGARITRTVQAGPEVPPSLGYRIRLLGHKYSKAIGLGGYLLLTLQWCMEDVLLLRCFGLACASSMAIFLYCQPVPLMVPVRFNLLFIVINAVFVMRILLERRDLILDEVEQRLWDLGFNAFLTKVELRDLLSAGRRFEAEPGTVVAQSGMPLQETVLLLCSGGMSQTKAGAKIGRFEPGDFWGEFQLVERARGTGGGGRVWHKGDCYKTTTTFSEHSVAVEWDAAQLGEYLSSRPALKLKLQELLAEGLNLKLDRRNSSLTERAYVDILRGILCNGTIGEVEIEFLQHVRQVQNLSDKCHKDALLELGYSEKEFSALVARGKKPWLLRWLDFGGGRAGFASLGFKPESTQQLMARAVFLDQPSKKRPWLDLDVHVSGRSETGWSDSPCKRSGFSPWENSPSSSSRATPPTGAEKLEARHVELRPERRERRWSASVLEGETRSRSNSNVCEGHADTIPADINPYAYAPG
eukprot:TRINITY_DN43217_c0_g1_i1.p1 TRINITY_DN43217_c0_g1~~TRINITY_DN43217_c0_g1_i1.p1  ORF type:complete len:512 (-),score=55.38 TRINITY_DN43217_c0_g1_i1:48-1583(-)